MYKRQQETLLIIDATTGQNGLSQAEAFMEVTNITGVILTKLDGTSKGGIVLAIRDKYLSLIHILNQVKVYV